MKEKLLGLMFVIGALLIMGVAASKDRSPAGWTVMIVGVLLFAFGSYGEWKAHKLRKSRHE